MDTKHNYTLGIACFYHDSAAALLRDGVVICAVGEERFTRRKHDNSFPENAIRYCLFHAGITVEDLSDIAFYENPALKFQRYLKQHLIHSPLTFSSFRRSFPSWIKEKLSLEEILKQRFGYQGTVKYVDHHLAHAASAYYLSGFTSAAYVTIDGVGEWDTTTYGKAKNNELITLASISFPDSIGLVYSAITAFLGFTVNDSEYKVMGLAAYGNTERSSNPYYKKLQQVIDLKDDGSYKINMRFFNFLSSKSMFTHQLIKLLGIQPRNSEQPMTKAYEDIAAAIQMLNEDVAISIFNYVQGVTSEENLVFAGGVALNSTLNGKILSKTRFKNLYIQPAAGDNGGSLGAALYAYYQGYPNASRQAMNNVYLGPEFSDEDIVHFLDAHYINYSYCADENELIAEVAQLLNANNVVGWFQGKMEWGPRALGNRSILANPCNSQMQNILNSKVKHREEFRPFAPAVCTDDANKYFLCDQPLPDPTKFMLMVYPVVEEYRSLLPSITHVDGTARLQIVEKEQNRLFYDLIKQFGKLSGVPVIINTSFNIKGEPIVCTPKDAYYCMMGTEIDYLVMGKYLIKRQANSEDAINNNTVSYLANELVGK